MKTKTTVKDITHDDLVDLLSTSLTGSQFFGADYDSEAYKKCPDRKEDDCFEDKMARILLNGGCVTISDLYAEDEYDFYGELKHEFDSEYCCMNYLVTLQDIEKGLSKCASGDFEKNEGYETSEPSYMRRCFNDLLAGEGDLDLYEAQNLMQVIIFGKLIYG